MSKQLDLDMTLVNNKNAKLNAMIVRVIPLHILFQLMVLTALASVLVTTPVTVAVCPSMIGMMMMNRKDVDVAVTMMNDTLYDRVPRKLPFN